MLAELGKLMQELESKMLSMHDMTIVTQSDTIVNEHFNIPGSVDPFYTGREDEAKTLSEWMFLDNVQVDASAAHQTTNQKCFVVCGVGGSGKTQFCSKFAQDHRSS